ncbi:MAG: hypothetical protein RMH84_07145 [Sulfolobales archaeon]|nr:hypothetical protein [Sulfolobales archaeon]MDW8011348.1 hypothetical protein [Sulfolobales archaeon]
MEALHDFLAIAIAAVVAVASSYLYPPLTSLSIFLAACGIWLMLTGPLAPATREFGLQRRVSRSSLGGALLLVATVLHLYSAGAELRAALITLLTFAVAVVIYLRWLSGRVK